MTKTELVKRLAEKTGLSADDAAAAVEALFAVDGGIIAEEMAGGAPVQIDEFGSFEPVLRLSPAERARMGDEGGPPAAPVFRPGSGWRNAGPRLRGGKKPPRGTGSTGPRRDDNGGPPGTGSTGARGGGDGGTSGAGGTR